MAVSVIETIKSRANAGNTAYIVVVKLLCDDYSDLPTQSGLSGYELAQGCIAHVINENKDFMIDSSGNWHVYGGDSWTNVYTKSETDALLDDKQDELTTVQLDAVNSGITAAKLTTDEAALVELVDAGAKNLYPPFETQSSKGGTGVTYSYSGGIVYAKGTKSSPLNYIDVVERSKISELGLKVGDVIKLYNTSDNLRLGVLLGDGTTFDPAITVGNEVKEVTIGAGKTHIYIRAQILSSFTGTVDFSATPMVCKKSLYDISPAFVSYALPNPTLTPAAIKAVDEGAKNICNWGASTSTISGVTFTINSDKTVSTSGTATERSQKSLAFTVPSTLKAGRYVLSGCPSGGAQSGTTYYCLYIWDKTANARVCSDDTGNAIEFDWIPDPSHAYAIAVDVRSGSNASGLIFRPMICTAADWAVSQKFVPYCPSMQEMYQMILALQ